MIPEAKLINSETTIRELTPTSEVKLTKKSMVRWLALSLGLVSPNESRTLVLDILEVLFAAHIKKQRLSTQELLDQLEKNTNEKPNPKAVYYHLLKLKDTGLLKNKDMKYYLGEENQSLFEVIRELYTQKVNSSFQRIEEITNTLEHSV